VFKSRWFLLYFNIQATRYEEHPKWKCWLELAIIRVTRWAMENSFFFYTGKTQRLHFTRLRTLQPYHTPYLNNTALPFAHSPRFPGLCLDNKLCCELHLRQRRANCERSLKYIKSTLWHIKRWIYNSHAPSIPCTHPLQNQTMAALYVDHHHKHTTLASALLLVRSALVNLKAYKRKQENHHHIWAETC
jgi:hypothetical protein